MMLTQTGGADDVFYMNLEEAKLALEDDQAQIAAKYEQLAERYEQRYPKHRGLL